MLGWGAFNLIEGIIDHHILEIHHVRDLPVHVPLYDWLFLGIGGVGLLLIGWSLARPRQKYGRREAGRRLLFTESAFDEKRRAAP